MPKTVRMPEPEEVPIHTQEPSGWRGHIGWFLRGFAAAALLFGAFLVYQDYSSSAVVSHDDTRTIIVGK
ncbi:MAG: hypothetical protein ACTHNH_13040 [Mesorhizobium sp.]